MVLKLHVLRCSTARNVLVAVAVIAVTSLQVAAAETSSMTEAEQLYQQTRKSSDRSIKLLGQRWYGLVKRQEWTDASGKFTTTARYLEHDPNLSWVKLRAERTTDGHREYKDVTVPVEKLSKTCQSWVRQIAYLEPKVREAADAAVKEAQDRAEERQSEQSHDAPASDTPDRGGDHHDSRRRDRRSADSSPAEPLPPESWPSNYDAFRANFTVEPRGDQYQVNWGSLGALQQVHDAMYSADGSSQVPGPLQAAGLVAQLASVGEFTWETRLTKRGAGDRQWAERLDLPPLPAPLSLELVLDHDSGNWQRLRVGDRVRLTGRFIAFAGQYKIVAAIRFPDGARTRR